MGRSNGANVGDLYRNEAGIALQMLKMEFLLTEGKKGLSGASKTFERIYELYKTDIDAFNKEFSLESNGFFTPKKTEHIENKSKKPVVVVIKNEMLSTQNNMADNENNKVSSETQNTDSEEKWKALDGILANYLTTSEPKIKSEEPIKIKLSNDWSEPSFNIFEEAKDTHKSDVADKYSELSQKIHTVLCEKYQKGFRLDSHLEKERFKLFFEQIHSEKISEEISEKLLDHLIFKSGIVYNDRVYIAENMLDENTKADLFAFINQSFENGHNTIYYTALFEEFSDEFLTQSIFDPDILREYLKYQNTGKYYVFKEYLSKDKSVNQSISDEIIQLLIDRSEPFFQDELSAMLPHIDKNKLIKELRSSSEFISNGKEQYFLARNFNITNDEIETVKKLISDLLDASSTHFITAAEVMEIIHKKVPEIFENNGFISELGVRNALASILGDSFSFNSNVISGKDTNLNLNDIFEDFAKNTSSFSLAELKNLASEFSAPIYFDAINKYAIRISKDEFIGKDKIDFNFKEIDHAISLFCQAGYTPIQAVNTFASFPDVGYKWNTFLLESYLQNYSPAFRLFQASACETKSVGAIVKKTSAYTSFDDILVDAVAKSRCQLQKDTILQFLCDYGYIARRTYSSIDNIIERASQKRNSKG